MSGAYHKPVMLNECLEGLNIKPGGLYVDLTFGGGGHTRAMLEAIGGQGTLFAFDRDDDAAKNAEAIHDKALVFTKANFRYFDRFLKWYGVKGVDGILADLGVSSHQIDSAERGFSTRFNGELDMRMDRHNRLSAAAVVNEYEPRQLRELLQRYGELSNAGKIAREIELVRAAAPVRTTHDLVKILEPLAPRGKEFKFYAQVFQALRIEVNDEMGALESMLPAAAKMLNPGGRLVVLTYHSLEDRPVKNFIRSGLINGEAEKDVYGNVRKPLEAVNRKLGEATPEEVAENSRARSAKLRIAERLDVKWP